METINLKEIAAMDSEALTEIIEYWKAYDPKKVLLAYAELKKRNYSILDRLTKRQNEFCTKYNYPDFDTFLNTYLKENGYNSYNEYFEKEVEAIKGVAVESLLKNTAFGYNSENKYPALRTISGIYRVSAWIIGIVTVLFSLLFLQAGEWGLIFTLISIVVGGLIILGVLAVAESIMVFIDIEYNTRQKKKNEKTSP